MQQQLDCHKTGPLEPVMILPVFVEERERESRLSSNIVTARNIDEAWSFLACKMKDRNKLREKFYHLENGDNWGTQKLVPNANIKKRMVYVHKTFYHTETAKMADAISRSKMMKLMMNEDEWWLMMNELKMMMKRHKINIEIDHKIHNNGWQSGKIHGKSCKSN